MRGQKMGKDMSSILTNTSSMAALETLRGINRNLQTVQAEVSSGKKVATAKDNAAVWTVGTIMTSDVASFKSISDSLSVAAATVGVARSVSEKIVSVLKEMKTLIVQAQDDNVDTFKYQTDIESRRTLIDNYVSSAQFNGLNLINGSTPRNGAGVLLPVNFIASLNRSGSAAPVVDHIEVTPFDLTRNPATVDIAGTPMDEDKAQGLFFELTAIKVTPNYYPAPNDTVVIPGSQSANAAAALTTIETILNRGINAAASFGSVQNQIESQNEFVMNLVDALTSGVGALTDTDMEAASAKLQALQVQQQLGVQSLSIANQAPQSLLALFRQ